MFRSDNAIIVYGVLCGIGLAAITFAVVIPGTIAMATGVECPSCGCSTSLWWW